MKNEGKLFEEQFKASVPNYTMIYRLPDQAQVFGYSDKVRFTQKNPCDFLMWDSKNRHLYWIELKSTKAKSMSFERTPKETGMIHNHQIAGLEKFSEWAGVTAGFVIEFRSAEPVTIFIDVNDFILFIRRMPKKSFTVKDLDEYRVPYVRIPQKLIRTRYSYDLESWLTKMEELHGE